MVKTAVTLKMFTNFDSLTSADCIPGHLPSGPEARTLGSSAGGPSATLVRALNPAPAAKVLCATRGGRIKTALLHRSLP